MRDDLLEGLESDRSDMPLWDGRQEAFARLVARGMSQVRAYEAAGYEPDTAHASRLRQQKAVDGRIRYLQAEFAKPPAEVLLENELQVLDNLREMAIEQNALDLARRITMDRLTATGQIVKKVEQKIETTRNVVPMPEKDETTEQWEARIAAWQAEANPTTVN